MVCHNPEQADRDAAVRHRLVAHLQGLIDGSDAWTGRRRHELVGSLKTKPGLRRYLRRTPGGLRVDAAAAKRKAHLDGKWLLRTSDLTLTPEDLAAAYKQLLAVERGWRDLKGALGLRPVFHHREEPIRAHVQLRWLALLLLRVVENTTGDTWRNVRHELDRMHLVTLATAGGQVAQRSTTTAGQKTILTTARAPTVHQLHRPQRLTGLRRRSRRGPVVTDPSPPPRRLRRSHGTFWPSCAHDLRTSGQRVNLQPLLTPGRQRRGAAPRGPVLLAPDRVAAGPRRRRAGRPRARSAPVEAQPGEQAEIGRLRTRWSGPRPSWPRPAPRWTSLERHTRSRGCSPRARNPRRPGVRGRRGERPGSRRAGRADLDRAGVRPAGPAPGQPLPGPTCCPAPGGAPAADAAPGAAERAYPFAERVRILEMLNSPRFGDKSVTQTWATLLDEGVYLAARSSMHRVLRAAGQARERRRQATHPPRVKPELLAIAPGQVWSWDRQLRGRYYDVYVVLDIYSRCVVGWTVAAAEDSQIAKALIAAAVRHPRTPPSIHAVRGTSMTSKPVAQLLVDLGVAHPHSRPHVSNDNPYYAPVPRRVRVAARRPRVCEEFFRLLQP